MHTDTVRYGLKDGGYTVIRSPVETDLIALLNLHMTTINETPFTGRAPEDLYYLQSDVTTWIQRGMYNKYYHPIVCFIEGVAVGAATLEMYAPFRTRHRCRMSFELMQKYWGSGAANAMMKVLLDKVSHYLEVEMVEVDVFSCNVRAIHFYEKWGFKPVCIIPDVLRLNDGTSFNEVRMVLALQRSNQSQIKE